MKTQPHLVRIEFSVLIFFTYKTFENIIMSHWLYLTRDFPFSMTELLCDFFSQLNKKVLNFVYLLLVVNSKAKMIKEKLIISVLHILQNHFYEKGHYLPE